jgi:hypothetical protein
LLAADLGEVGVTFRAQRVQLSRSAEARTERDADAPGETGDRDQRGTDNRASAERKRAGEKERNSGRRD